MTGLDMELQYQLKENGDGPHHVDLYQVILDGVGELYMMEQILPDVVMVQIFLLLNLVQ
mgnify:CR=1 FL=1